MSSIRRVWQRFMVLAGAAFALAAAAPVLAQQPIKILALDVTSGPFKDIGDRFLRDSETEVRR